MINIAKSDRQWEEEFLFFPLIEEFCVASHGLDEWMVVRWVLTFLLYYEHDLDILVWSQDTKQWG